MSTLPLYWKLSSSATDERLGASVDLVSSLEQFQLDHAPEPYLNGAATDESTAEEVDPSSKPKSFIESITSEDVRYALKRLTRGLASPKESSRLGFAVALTELLSRLSVVTANQVITLVVDASEISGNVKGQQLRDLLFARLFGLNCLVQEKGEWFPEKLAAVAKMQRWFPSLNWGDLVSPTFKDGQVLSSSSLVKVSAILRETSSEGGDDEEGLKLPKHHRIWRPELHFAWDALISRYSDSSHPGANVGAQRSNIREFFRVVVDESLLQPNSTPERKFWGISAFRLILSKAAPEDIPQLLTQNFTKLWMHQLSGRDRALSKVARDAVNDLKVAVEKHPEVGIKVVFALLGNSGGQFDRLSHTKIVENILGKADEAGVKSYVDYLIDTAYSAEGDPTLLDASTSAGRRKWAIDQLSGIVRSGDIPRSDGWISAALHFLLVHGFFLVKKKNKDSDIELMRRAAPTGFSDEVHAACRQQLYSCLAFLLRYHSPKTASMHPEGAIEPPKVNGIANDGESWLAKTIRAIQALEKDARHASLLREETDEDEDIRKAARKALKRLSKLEPRLRSGLELLLQSYILRSYDPGFDAVELFRELTETSINLIDMGPTPPLKPKRKGKVVDEDEDEEPPEPIDVVLDSLIGNLESDSAYEREVANVVFDLICQDFRDSSVELLLTQIARRDPTSEDVDEMEDEESNGSDAESVEAAPEDDDSESGDSDDSDDVEGSGPETDQDEEVDPELRKRIAEALQMEDILEGSSNSDSQEEDSDDDNSDESDIEMMDDEQMMALDDKLAEIFRSSRAASKKSKDGAQRQATLFKTRVVDFIETFVKRNARTNYAIKTVMPLVSLAAASSRDEDHMSKKATKVLKTAFSKTDDLIDNLDVSLASETLRTLHQTAKKVHGVDIASVFNPPTRYLVRNLARAGESDVIQEEYVALLNDYIKHKQSKVPVQTLEDFIRTTPA
ncbi:DNA-directed DNA polymerase, partial [Tulasnella sp. 417]